MITLKNITLRRGGKIVLEGASATLNPGEKIGLVGRNGAGKSSLFALMTGILHEDAGEIFIPAQWRIAQVAQEMPETIEDATSFVVAGDTFLMAAQREVIAAEASNDGERMGYAYAAWHDAGAHDAKARAQALILGLGFKTNELDLPVNSFSGGWRMRLQLARALMCPSELLLLDEPTNHLDLDALIWLETWLKRYTGTLLVISHDREFLDATTQITFHIEHAKLNRYGGSYSIFEELRAEQINLQQAAFAKHQEQIAHLQKFITRFKAKASKAKQAQSRVKALGRLEKIAPVLADADFTFEFKAPKNLPNPMLVISRAELGYTSQTGHPRSILQKVDRTVLAGGRIGILGANGQGKSTLVKTIAHSLPLLTGSISEGRGLTMGYFAQQELDVLRPEDNALEHMLALAKQCAEAGTLAQCVTGGREQDLRSHLGGFNFSGDMVKQNVGSMSGGEKARLVLAMIVWQSPNLLLLDEPTNHLDLATREALCIALNEFEGTVMLVSHDRALLRAVCDEFWLVGAGTVADFSGDLDDYQRYILTESKRLAKTMGNIRAQIQTDSSAAVAASHIEPKSKCKPKSKAAELPRTQRNLEKIEQAIVELEVEQRATETALAEASAVADIERLGNRLHQITLDLECLEVQWLQLAEGIN